MLKLIPSVITCICDIKLYNLSLSAPVIVHISAFTHVNVNDFKINASLPEPPKPGFCCNHGWPFPHSFQTHVSIVYMLALYLFFGIQYVKTKASDLVWKL
jgi:hypothetical protein